MKIRVILFDNTNQSGIMYDVFSGHLQPVVSQFRKADGSP